MKARFLLIIAMAGLGFFSISYGEFEKVPDKTDSFDKIQWNVGEIDC